MELIRNRPPPKKTTTTKLEVITLGVNEALVGHVSR